MAWIAEGADLVGSAATRLAECGVESPRLEAQLLLALALGITRTAVVAGLFDPPAQEQAQSFSRLVNSRCRHIPLAYLRGTQEFYGLEFAVGPVVLIPRPETEMLVDFAREILALEMSSKGSTSSACPVIADVGTGSGCIAIAALAYCPVARGIALDLSEGALEVARGNAARQGVIERLRFLRGSLLAGAGPARFDLILSNPPYIPSSQIAGLQPEVRDSEPRLALDGGPSGLDPYRELAPAARRSLKPGGTIAVEVGMGQAPEVAAIFGAARLTQIEIRRDLAGIERVVTGRSEVEWKA